MIAAAVDADGATIRELTAQAGVFREEEVQCLAELWDEYRATGPRASGYNFLVARDGQRVLGYACYGPRDLASGVFDLYWIAVDPTHRGRGIGRQLLEACEAATRSAGGRMLIAETSGTALYDATRRFYDGRGYLPEARLRDFYREGDDLVIYVKRFPAADQPPGAG